MCRSLHNIEPVNADLKDSALTHMPSSVFAAKSAWLVAAVMAYTSTRAAGILAAVLWQGPYRNDPPQTHPHPGQDRHQPPTHPASPARSRALANTMAGPVRPALPAAASRLNAVHPAIRGNENPQWDTRSEARHPSRPSGSTTSRNRIQPIHPGGSVDQGGAEDFLHSVQSASESDSSQGENVEGDSAGTQR